MTDEQIKVRIEQIDKQLEAIDVELDKIEKVWDFSRPYEEYQLERKPLASLYGELYAEKRQIMPYVLSPLSDFGHVMKLEEFVECVKMGTFIDYDGYGNYVKDDQESDVEVYPSDVKKNRLRKDFDTIIWFNR